LPFYLSICLQNQNSSVKLSGINSTSIKEQLLQQRNAKDEMQFIRRNDAYNMTKLISTQKRLPHDITTHNTLARTTSTPINNDANQVISNLYSSLNDILNAGTAVAGMGHRKLERTQSEPLPQTNTSRYVR